MGNKRTSSRIAYSIGISIALETIVSLLKTSGISIAGFELSSISVYLVYAILFMVIYSADYSMGYVASNFIVRVLDKLFSIRKTYGAGMFFVAVKQ